jgi:hypothetical protein
MTSGCLEGTVPQYGNEIQESRRRVYDLVEENLTYGLTRGHEK